jgi:hypothetical protein
LLSLRFSAFVLFSLSAVPLPLPFPLPLALVLYLSISLIPSSPSLEVMHHVFSITDLATLIFSQLDLKDLVPLRAVSKRWRDIVSKTPAVSSTKQEKLAPLVLCLPRIRKLKCNYATSLSALTNLADLSASLTDETVYLFPRLTRLDCVIHSENANNIRGPKEQQDHDFDLRCLSLLTSLQCLSIRHSGFGGGGTFGAHRNICNEYVLTLFPLLRQLDLHGYSSLLKADQCALLTNLTQLRSIRLPLTVFSERISSPLYLEHLTAMIPYGFAAGDPTWRFDLFSKGYISLPRLQSLYLEDYGEEEHLGHAKAFANQLTSLTIYGGYLGSSCLLPPDFNIGASLRFLSLYNVAIPPLSHSTWEGIQPLVSLERLSVRYVYNACALLAFASEQCRQVTNLTVTCSLQHAPVNQVVLSFFLFFLSFPPFPSSSFLIFPIQYLFSLQSLFLFFLICSSLF